MTWLAQFQASDSIAHAGQLWGLYRAGLKKLSSQEAVQQAVKALDQTAPRTVRLAAAHYLARTPDIDLTPHWNSLFIAAHQDADVDVRMASIRAMAKVNRTTNIYAGSVLNDLLLYGEDYRERVNALAAMDSSDYDTVKETVTAALYDPNPNVAIAAANYLARHADSAYCDTLFDKASRIANWRVRAKLLATASELAEGAQKEQIHKIIQKLYSQSTNRYEQAHLLQALASDRAFGPWIGQQTLQTPHAIVRTTGLQALAAIASHKDLPEAQLPEYLDLLQSATTLDDPLAIALVAYLLRDKEWNLKERYPAFDWHFLLAARDKLSLPRDREAYEELQQTIAYFEGKPYTPPTPIADQPINWDIVTTIPTDHEVVVHTSGGPITCRLLVDEAPGSVANFVQRAQEGFYTDLVFHRVVPNFVVQGGCPRGDGMGSATHTIRSEFGPLNYNAEGYIGMASSGKDTESCQWFITHSPTPHLDGRYSIFAKVVDGMGIVHLLDIGDRIDSVQWK